MLHNGRACSERGNPRLHPKIALLFKVCKDWVLALDAIDSCLQDCVPVYLCPSLLGDSLHLSLDVHSFPL